MGESMAKAVNSQGLQSCWVGIFLRKRCGQWSCRGLSREQEEVSVLQQKRRELGQTAQVQTWGQRVRTEKLKSRKEKVSRGHGQRR